MSAIRYNGSSIVAPSKNQWRPNTAGGSGEPLRLEATSGRTATFAQTLSSVSLVSAARNAIAATSAVSLGAITLSATATLPSALAASVAQTLGSVTLSSAARAALAASALQTLGAVTATASAANGVAAALAQALGAVTSSSTAAARIGAALGQTLGAVTLTADGVRSATGLVADLSVELGPVTLSAVAEVSQPAPAQAPSTARGGIAFKRGRKKPSFIGVPDVPQRQQPPKAPSPRRASLQITLGRIGCSSDASLGIHPAVLRRRRVAVALLLS